MASEQVICSISDAARITQTFQNMYGNITSVFS